MSSPVRTSPVRASLTPGDTFEQVLVDDLKRTQVVMYAGASGDFNPLHTVDVHTREIGGFPGVFAHGMLTMAMAMTGTLVTEMLGIERLLRFGGRFTAQVWPGDTLTAVLTVRSVDDGVVEAGVRTVNQHGLEVFSGTAVARA